MNKTEKTLVLALISLIGICLIPTLNQAAPAQKLDFYAMEWPDPEIPPIMNDIFFEDGVLHIKDYIDFHWLAGTIGENEITGWTESFFHVKDDFSGLVIVNGLGYMYMTWGDLEGYFMGPKNIRILNGELTGQYSLQGFGDFEGMTLKGIIWGNVAVNYFSGTILIPN